jgi:solute carrier family 25 carnitine/acylcarnitine transporter 20/29
MIQQSWNGDKPLSIFQHGLAGLAGGLTVSFVATPVEQIKARLQVQYDAKTKTYKGPIDCIRQVVCFILSISAFFFFLLTHPLND